MCCAHLERNANLVVVVVVGDDAGRFCAAIVTGGLALLLNNRAGVLLAAKWGGIHAGLISRQFVAVVQSRIYKLRL